MKDGRVYEWLGVKYVKKAVMGTAGKFIGYLEKKYKKEDMPEGYFIKKLSLENLQKFQDATRHNESIHGFISSLAGIMLLYTIKNPIYDLANELLLVGAFGINVAIVMLQRYNRYRAQNVIERRYGTNPSRDLTPQQNH